MDVRQALSFTRFALNSFDKSFMLEASELYGVHAFLSRDRLFTTAGGSAPELTLGEFSTRVVEAQS